MIAIISAYGANYASIQYALKRINVEAILTTDPNIILSADKVILPGVSNAGHAMQKLQQAGLIDTIKQLTQPFLGICLGMQLLYDETEEGDVKGLSLFKGMVQKIKPQPGITIPHMGWNEINILQPSSALLKDIKNQSHCYFVHSFAAPITDETTATSTHGDSFAATVENNNFFATQFHPEKSSLIGQQLLTNFVSMT